MLFHLLSGENRGVDIEQIGIRIQHPLIIDQFIEAWNRLISHHTVLRVSFHWSASESPSQEFGDAVPLVTEVHDWRHLTSHGFEEKFSAYKATDRVRNFDVSKPPLMRVVFFNTPSQETICLWTFHHLVLDGRSFSILLDELFNCYDALVDKREPVFSSRPEYSAFLDWYQNRQTTGEKEFWSKELSGIQASVALNFDPTADGSDISFYAEERIVPKEETCRLLKFAEDHGVTMNTLLQAAWSLMVHHYTREDDIVFGSTRACRHGSIPDADQVVGMLINTVPIRVQFEVGVLLQDLLFCLREKQIAIRPYEFTPLTDIRRFAGIVSDHIFESLVVYDNSTLNDYMQRHGGEWLQRHFEYRGQTGYSLALVAYGGQQTTLRLEYDGSKFSSECIKGLLDNTLCLLKNFPDNAATSAVKIDYITEQQKKELLCSSATLASKKSSERCLHELFEMRARETPESIALSFEQGSMTYRELNDRANQLANMLVSKQVRPGDLVGLCLERSSELIVGLLAILKTGAAYVPLDPSYPVDRLVWILEDAGIKQLLSHSLLIDKLPGSRDSVDFIDVAGIDTEHSFPSEFNSINSVRSSAIAYVIYTSGSTGKPKGVKVSHANVVRLFHSTEHWFDFDDNDVWTLFHSTAFDFSVWEIWGALIYGGRLVVVPYWVSRSPDKFYQLVLDESVTVLNQTPSAFRQFMECALSGKSSESNRLRYVIFGGEALELESLNPWTQMFGDDRPKLINMYGITETTVHVTYRQITKNDINNNPGSVIGFPIPDLYIYLLNQWMQPVPIGIVGEMYVGGAGVADGYLNREALTSERFLFDLWQSQSSTTNRRLYKTGDLARQLPNGEYEYIGRSDSQVKIRGFRIETGEIESTLNQHPEITRSIVNIFSSADEEKRLVAYIQYIDGNSIPTSQLREFLLQSLPEYMIPALFMSLDKIPLTHNGKVDKKALPDPTVQLMPVSSQVAPRTAVEKLLASVWQTVLGVKHLGIHDNYFDIGGDSILTIKIVAALSDHGYRVSPREIFKYKTIESLAPRLVEQSAHKVSQEAVVGDIALLPAQQWFFKKDFANINHWNQAFIFNVDGELASEKLDRAFGRLSEHHDSLRAIYSYSDGVWQQTFRKHGHFHTFQKIDLSSFSLPETTEKIEDCCFKLQQNLDITVGLLASVALFTLADNSSKLFICIHHVVMDGVSWGILLEDLESLYHVEDTGKKTPLPAKSESVQTWNSKLSTYIGSAKSRANLFYWQNLNLDNLSNLGSHSGTIKAAERTTLAAKGVLNKSLTTSLLTAANTAYGTRVNDLLLSPLGTALKNVLQADNVLVDVEGHGREDCVGGLDVSRTIGWFTSIYPVLLTTRTERSMSSQIQSVKENLRAVPNNGLDFFANKHLPLLNLNGDAPATAVLPDSPVLFNYLGQFDQLISGLETLSFSGLETGNWHGGNNSRTHLLEIICLVRNGCLEITFLYSEDNFDSTLIRQLKDSYLVSLTEIIEHCLGKQGVQYSPSDFPLMEISQIEIDRLQSNYDLLNIYPLSPMQSLFYTADILDPANGFEQWQFLLEGPLDSIRYQRAWQLAIDNHDILRTAVVELDNGRSCQLVCSEAALDWSEHDLCGIPDVQQISKLEQLLADDQKLHFKLDTAPLVRVTLIKLATERYHLIWSTHHLCVDGWSWPVIFRDIASNYGVSRSSSRQAAQYGSYITWLEERDRVAIEQFWRKTLQGFEAPLSYQRLESSRVRDTIIWQYQLADAVAKTFNEFCARNGITLNTLFQALFAIILSRGFKRHDIVFGISSSGRPAEIPSVDSIAGPFVNNLPKRIQIPINESSLQADADADDQSRLTQWLLEIQAASLDMGPYEHATPHEIQGYCGYAVSKRLFETLLVFQNYETTGIDKLDGGVEDEASIKISSIAEPQSTNYPVTLVVKPGSGVLITGYMHADFFTDTDAEDIVKDMSYVFDQFVQNHSSLLDLAATDGFWVARVPETRQVNKSEPMAAFEDTALVNIVSRVWANTFGFQKIDHNQSFFDMGGQSVQLVSMHAELQTLLNRNFPVTTFFKYPTINALSEFLENGDSRPDAGQGKQIERMARRNAARKNRKARSGRLE